MISQVISRLFESEDGDNPVIEAKEPLNFSKDHMDDEIWEQICDIQSTPALRQSWTKSQSHSGWLQSIRIDPNNMVNFDSKFCHGDAFFLTPKTFETNFEVK